VTGSIFLSIGRDPIRFVALLGGLQQSHQLDRTDRVFEDLNDYESCLPKFVCTSHQGIPASVCGTLSRQLQGVLMNNPG
jgi:hypothetical protein